MSGRIENFKNLKNDLEESEILLDLAVEESDDDTIKEVLPQIQAIDERVDKLSLDLMLDDADDQSNAIVSINAGAGGTEAQDWVEMLFRMYLRWIERKGFKVNMVDYQPDD